MRQNGFSNSGGKKPEYSQSTRAKTSYVLSSTRTICKGVGCNFLFSRGVDGLVVVSGVDRDFTSIYRRDHAIFGPAFERMCVCVRVCACVCVIEADCSCITIMHRCECWPIILQVCLRSSICAKRMTIWSILMNPVISYVPCASSL